MFHKELSMSVVACSGTGRGQGQRTTMYLRWEVIRLNSTKQLHLQVTQLHFLKAKPCLLSVLPEQPLALAHGIFPGKRTLDRTSY